jgi:hypothetical protein
MYLLLWELAVEFEQFIQAMAVGLRFGRSYSRLQYDALIHMLHYDWFRASDYGG